MSRKKIGVIIGVIVIAAGAAAAAVWKFGGNFGHDSKDRVYVEKVSAIMGRNAGMQNRYPGVVQPQKSVDINADSERTIKEFFVKVGDTVEEGTPLFAYDTDEVEMELQQAKLENENADLEISGYRRQIEELKKERDAAAEGDKFEYTTQIQTVETQIRQAEFEKSNKNLEVEKIQKKIDQSQVLSTAAGVIKTLNDPKNQSDNYSGENNATISIMVTGNYRVKGTLDEQTINAISPGSSVIVRSRVDENKTWNGIVDKIDTGETSGEEAEEDSFGGEENSNSATKYPFYISLEDTSGLILGQHVLIELDEGQSEVKDGLWLYASYLVKEDGSLFREGISEEDSFESLYPEDDGVTEWEVFEDTEAGTEILPEEAGISMEKLPDANVTMAAGAPEKDGAKDAPSVMEVLTGEDKIPGEALPGTEQEAGDVPETDGAAGMESLTDTEEAYEEDPPGQETGEGDARTQFTQAYVWADDGDGKLMLRPVELGEYDAMLDEYQILSGLTENDLIAWPMEGLYEGVKTVTNEDEIDYSSDLYNMESGTEDMWDDGTEMLYDTDIYDTEFYPDETDFGSEIPDAGSLDDGDSDAGPDEAGPDAGSSDGVNPDVGNLDIESPGDADGTGDSGSDNDADAFVNGDEVRSSWQEGALSESPEGDAEVSG